MAKIVIAPNEDYSIETINENCKLFLAGGISNCPDWQEQLVNRLGKIPKLTVYNPRRDDFNKDTEMEQICWEHDKLAKADIIVFWFTNATNCPITLYELGKYSTTNKPMVIGIEEGYTRKSDVIIQTSLARPDVDYYSDFANFTYAVMQAINKWNTSKNV
jgi:hypothetical protein